MTRMNQVRPFIMCADFEACASGTTYAKEKDDTFIYAIHVCTVPVYLRFGHATTKTPWQPTKWIRGWNRQKHYIDKDFGTWDDFIDYFLHHLANPNQQIMLYFHNGQKFDFVFIEKWLINNNWYRALTDEDEEEIIKTKQNYYCWNKATGWNAGVLNFWMGNGYCHLELRDTIKIQLGSIKEIGEDLFGNKGTYHEEIKNIEWFKKLDLTKKPLDVSYVDDLIDGETVICKDGYKFNIHRPSNWPKMIKERVGSDVYIMVGLLYFYILNQVINPQNYSSNICMTTGQVAIYSYFLDIIKREGKKKTEKEDEVYARYYGSDWQTRFNEYLLLQGNWDLLDDNEEEAPKIARGGFTNGMIAEQGKILKGWFLSYDVNSEYPFISTGKCPYGAGSSNYTWEEIMANDDLWGVIWVKAKRVEQLVKNVPAMLLAKWSEKDEESNAIYEYELDDFYGCFTKQEWKVFSDSDYFKWVDVKPVKCVGWITKPLIKDFMEENYKAKLKASEEHNKTAKLIAKLKLNSLTGKFSQKLLKIVKLNPQTFTYEHLKKQLGNIKGLDDDMKETLEESDFRYEKAKARGQNLQLLVVNEVSFSNTAIYSFITGGGRAWIQSHMLELGWAFQDQIKVIYGDTDSMKIWCKNQDVAKEVNDYLKEQNLIDDNKLGCFKEEFNGKVKTFKYVCPKKYLCGDEDENIITNKSALSGLKWENIFVKYPHPKLTDIAVGSKFLTLKPSIVKHGVLLNETEYEIKE